MSYTRAVWIEIEEEYEGTVPSVWIKDGKVYWPRGLNVRKSFQILEKPSNHWHSYLLKKTKGSGSAEFCDECNEFTTSVEDEEYAVGTKYKYKSQEVIRNLPKFPKRSSCSEEIKIVKHRSLDRSLDLTNHENSIPNPSTSSTLGKVFETNFIEEFSSTFQPRKDGVSYGINKFPLSDAEFQFKTISLLTEIRNAAVSKNENKFILSESVKRLETLIEVKEIDLKIKQDKSSYLELVGKLSKISGISVKEAVKNILRSVFSYEALAHFNMKGQNKKESNINRPEKSSFQQLKLCEAVTDAVLIIHGDTTREHIKKEIMYVLKYAPDKAGQGRRRSSIDASSNDPCASKETSIDVSLLAQRSKHNLSYVSEPE
ncbi:uncharacterized protein LOC136074947 [Hydra vulgaris]|uniref:Uncharacterized protein LOC136074947 n=1 Tax=Hydra vulgaris TaxID=6087 RepID=A0ABM4B337_HYDVU